MNWRFEIGGGTVSVGLLWASVALLSRSGFECCVVESGTAWNPQLRHSRRSGPATTRHSVLAVGSCDLHDVLHLRIRSCLDIPRPVRTGAQCRNRRTSSRTQTAAGITCGRPPRGDIERGGASTGRPSFVGCGPSPCGVKPTTAPRSPRASDRSAKPRHIRHATALPWSDAVGMSGPRLQRSSRASTAPRGSSLQGQASNRTTPGRPFHTPRRESEEPMNCGGHDTALLTTGLNTRRVAAPK